MTQYDPGLAAQASSTENPLIQIDGHIQFHTIQPQHYETAVAHHIETLREKIEKICALKPSERTFENTLLAIEVALQPLQKLSNILSLLGKVKNSGDDRMEYAKVLPQISKELSLVLHNQDLYSAVHSYSMTDDAKALTGERKRFFDLTLQLYEKNGCHLIDEEKQRLADIEIHLATLASQFLHNITDSSKEFSILITDENDLSGIPKHLLSIYKDAATRAEKKGWLITLENSSASTAMTYLDDRSLRERIFRAQCSVASSGEHSNREIIHEILCLRHEKAKLLGFNSFADFITSDRMAKTPENALSFLLQLKEDSTQAFNNEVHQLNQFRKKLEGSTAPECEPWDLAYYAEKLRSGLFRYSTEELAPYLQAEKVFEGFFEIVGELYGVSVKEIDSLSVWSPEVKTYALYGSEQELLGIFYVDIYARPGKNGSAWFSTIEIGSNHSPHLGVFCANFKREESDSPSLLSLNNVKTLFHELGHLMHIFLYQGEIRSLASDFVPWDFIELPSQIMENWYKKPEILSSFAFHFETGEALPFDLLQKIEETRNFRIGTYLQRQIAFSILDLKLHMSEEIKDPITYATHIIQESFPSTLPDDYALLCSMQHLFGHPVGYAAGFYSYLWGDALQAEAFSRFLHEGVLNPSVGGDFKKLLEAGNTLEVTDSYSVFIGNGGAFAAPDGTKLLRSVGIM